MRQILASMLLLCMSSDRTLPLLSWCKAAICRTASKGAPQVLGACRVEQDIVTDVQQLQLAYGD